MRSLSLPGTTATSSTRSETNSERRRRAGEAEQ
jgi:hypothetical protein